MTTITADFTITVTFFDDHAARTKQERNMPLSELAAAIRTTNSNHADPETAKRLLPWLKLARFGSLPTERNSLRWDGNMLSISGVECDYDGEEMSLDDAVAIVEKAGLGCLIYTSPRYHPERPRWRILAPTSRLLPPAARASLLSRVNGLFHGVFAVESWVLSQSYFFGSVNSNPAHQAVIVEGEAIEHLDELDLIAIGPGKDEPPIATPDAPHRASRHGAGAEALDIAAALAVIPNARRDWKHWYDVAMAVWAASNGSDAGFAAFVAWSQQIGPDVFSYENTRQKWHEITRSPPTKIGAGSLFHWAKEAWPGWEKPSEQRGRREQDPGEPPPHVLEPDDPGEDGPPPSSPRSSLPEGVGLADFLSAMQFHKYIFRATGDLWPASSINARIAPIKIGTDKEGNPVFIPAATWLDRNQPVEQMSWCPGLPQIIRDRLIDQGGWIERRGVSIFNHYRPPAPHRGDPNQAGRWIAHVEMVYPDDAQHIIRWLAHRVQKPHEKVNHALVLGGDQGIGKDSLIEPVKRAVGPWNVAEPSPVQLTGRFNGFVRSVILRISEGHDLGEITRYAFYEHIKVYTAAPPDVIRVDQKFLIECNVPNVTGVIITTNHRTDGIYLPADDRRHYVAWSRLTKDDFTADYWVDLWGWYDSGGDQHVAAYLASLDLSGFDPKAPPPKTEAFWAIVNANLSPEDAELADCLDLIDRPEAVTLARVIVTADGNDMPGFVDWLKDRKNLRHIGHRFEACGYTPIRNPDNEKGLWRTKHRRTVIYARDNLTFHEQLAAARELTRR